MHEKKGSDSVLVVKKKQRMKGNAEKSGQRKVDGSKKGQERQTKTEQTKAATPLL